LGSRESIPIAGIYSEYSTSFVNRSTPDGRIQYVSDRASMIHPYLIPEIWRSCSIVHFGPVLGEIDLSLLRLFPDALLGVTPQGWLRERNEDGSISRSDWPEAAFVLDQVDAAVLSDEDVGGDEQIISMFAENCRILAITTGPSGCRLYLDGYRTDISAGHADEVDSTGAGDIFAAAFFTQLFRKEDPLDAARFATKLATASISRRALAGVPTEAEIYEAASSVQPSRAPDLPQ
jgi:sugar/nucleoside kinase (ribokinase family)